MTSIKSEQACLLELLKAGLFNKSLEIPAEVNWEKVFELARSQCVIPLVASCVPEKHREEWLHISYQNKAYFMKMLYEQNDLINLLKANSIPFIILKGTAAAIYYRNPALRTYGDIDFMVAEEHVETVRDLLVKNNYIYISKNDRHYEFEKNIFEFELHSRFGIEFYNDIEKIFVNGMNNSVSYKMGAFTFPGLPVLENGLVLLCHLMQHLKITGIGLRQIIDWMMFVHAELDDEVWNKHFRALAVEAGLEKLAITVTFMCRKWLGLPNEITWCNNADEEVVDQLLIRILDDGNFGIDRAPFEVVKKTAENEGVFSYLQRAGVSNWEAAQKHRILRPFAWVYQLFRYGRKGFSGIRTGRKLFMKNKHNLTIEELVKRLED